MSSGKNKKKSKKSSGGGFPVIPLVTGVIVVAVLVGLYFGGKFVLGQRSFAKDYEASSAKVAEQLRRDTESVQGQLKLAEVAPLLTGNPVVTREMVDGADYSIYRWGTSQSIGFRLKIEKNGPVEEVAEMIPLDSK